MKKFACAAVCTLAAVGIVMAEEFNLQVTKLSDDMITGTKGGAGGGGGKGKGKGGKGGGKAEEVSIKIASSVEVYTGKFDMESKGFVKEGDNLKFAGLKTAMLQAENGNVTVDGKTLSEKDILELNINKDGKPGAKLNGKDIDFATVKVTGKAPLATHVITNDDGTVTTVLLIPAGGGFGGFGKKGKAGK